jgi:transcriptional regulator with XRE-family HTH domain
MEIDMASPTTLGAVIRSRRLELGLTQEELAERIDPDLRQSDVSRLERDRIALPRRRRLQAIADALDLTVGELLSASGWAGADRALASPDANRAVEHGLTAPAMPFGLVSDTIDLPTRSPEDVERLRAAINHAHDVRADAAELMRRLHAPTSVGD